MTNLKCRYEEECNLIKACDVVKKLREFLPETLTRPYYNLSIKIDNRKVSNEDKRMIEFAAEYMLEADVPLESVVKKFETEIGYITKVPDDEINTHFRFVGSDKKLDSQIHRM